MSDMAGGKRSKRQRRKHGQKSHKFIYIFNDLSPAIRCELVALSGFVVTLYLLFLLYHPYTILLLLLLLCVQTLELI